ncbi:unnamed protein product [Sphenostylis stenocarpa]|uniref:Uncharacterized protein n=1 Tax=Sphenostylis stenocarpa TaxID=92480 RepID=A0AA86VCM6_9FABA|nr:unnamed protein product [Sphenostylis stenocarpa]
MAGSSEVEMGMRRSEGGGGCGWDEEVRSPCVGCTERDYSDDREWEGRKRLQVVRGLGGKRILSSFGVVGEEAWESIGGGV